MSVGLSSDPTGPFYNDQILSWNEHVERILGSGRPSLSTAAAAQLNPNGASSLEACNSWSRNREPDSGCRSTIKMIESRPIAATRGL